MGMNALFVAALLSLSAAPAPTSSFAIDGAIPERHVRILASPEFGGRMTLAPSMYKTADYIKNEFKRYGLQPAGNEGYFFTYDLQINQRPTKMNAAGFRNGDQFMPLTLGTDYVPLVGSRHDTLLTAPVVFVGSKSAAESGDVAGKWVMMYRWNPSNARETSATTRANDFARAGARGVIFVGPIGEGRLELPLYARPQGISAQSGLVGVALHQKAFERITGIKFRTEPEKPIELPMQFRAVTGLETQTGRGRCVMAVLPGTDPKLKNEIIVIGAHHDHLGFGEVGSRTGNDILHPGADDNASGTAGVLALAEYFSRTGGNRRTIIFQAYSGEEIGLLGARAWVRANPQVVPNIQAMINMDMIGRLREERLTIFCVNSAAEFPSLLDSIKVQGVQYSKIMSSPGNSDHAPFIASRIPSLFFHTGLTQEYHTENDTVDTINWDGMTRVIEVVRQTVRGIDAFDQRLAFTAAPPAANTGGGDPNRARRVRTGFMPDLGATDPRGLRLAGVTPGSAAEAAGVRAGDILVSFAGKAIRTVEDLQAALTDARAGQAVTIVILRGDQRLELQLTPQAPAN